MFPMAFGAVTQTAPNAKMVHLANIMKITFYARVVQVDV